MIWPNKLNILSTVYKVKYKPAPWEAYKDDVRMIQFGNFDLEINEIIIARQGPGATEKTMLHEIIHAIVHEMNISEIAEHENEERIIDSLAVGLADVLIRNKFLK